MFVVIEDLRQADKLWEAGLIWVKFPGQVMFHYDAYNKAFWYPSAGVDTGAVWAVRLEE